MHRLSTLAVMVALLSAAVASAGDWPQWRGPRSNGVAASGPALANEFLKEGPKKLWESEPIPCGNSGEGGFSSVSVCDGKAYVHTYYAVSRKWRMVTKESLAAHGYSPDMPAALLKKLEEARLSPERAKIGGHAELFPFIDRWIKANTSSDDVKFAYQITCRLRLGKDAAPVDVLEKVSTVVDKKFETQDEWLKWVKNSGLDNAGQIAARPLAVSKEVSEQLFCLDAASGKTIWKSPMPAEDCTYPPSSTATVRDGCVYIFGSATTICCFSADQGKLLWQSQPLGQIGNPHGNSSSVLLINDLAVVVTNTGLNAVSLTDHKLRWVVPDPELSASGSAVIWQPKASSPDSASSRPASAPAKAMLLVELARDLAMVDPESGEVVSSAKGGGNSTPAIEGDIAVAPCKTGLYVYKLSPGKVEVLWRVTFPPDDFAGALLDKTHAYVVGGGIHYSPDNRDGKAACVELATGNILWQEKLPRAEWSSPILADGKVIAFVGPELLVFKANPQRFDVIGRFNLGLQKWCSPALADGKVFVRTPQRVVCYDLSAEGNSTATRASAQ